MGSVLEKWLRKLDCACDEMAVSEERDTQMDAQERYYTYMAEQYNKQEGDLHLQDGYVCEQCKNKGKIAKAVWTDMGYWTTVHYDCQCKPIRDNMNRMRKSGLQAVMGKYRFDTYETTEPWQETVKQNAVAYTEAQMGSAAEHRWFFIGGASGAGKSHICTAICREFLHQGKEVRYMLWRDETVALKANVNDSALYEKAIRALKTAEVLYIDDFFKCGQVEGGTQKPTEADIRLAFELLNYRYNQPDTITIISSESTLDAIFSIDEAVGGRIGERAQGHVINLTGKEKNYRRKMLGIAV